MFCEHCGAELTALANFCAKCGAKDATHSTPDSSQSSASEQHGNVIDSVPVVRSAETLPAPADDSSFKKLDDFVGELEDVWDSQSFYEKFVWQAVRMVVVFAFVLWVLSMISPGYPTQLGRMTPGLVMGTDDWMSVPGVTAADYRALQVGMSYREVIDILGEEGEEILRFDGYVNYGWEGFDGNPVALTPTFIDGRLTAKAQLGLQ